MQAGELAKLHPFPCIRSPKGENAGTDGRGTKSPLPIHSFQVNRERMGTDGNGRNGWSKQERIRCAGGVAFVARDCRDVLRELGTP